ncbi:MAG: FprA family A-type flavoprotein [Thermoplasmata archaeon]|nr:FprA family A-type flavoprotein [Thermoplasmata archaeon]
MIAKVADSIAMVTVEDPTDEPFEGRYPIPEGVTYNSYVIRDEKTAVLDTMDAKVTDLWKEELLEVLGDTTPDYLVVHHMEPDHAANIITFLEMFPSARIVTSAKAQKMMDQFFNRDMSSHCDIVSEGSVLELGKHSLRFIEAPFVHWPEVLMSYEQSEGILFSADGFGRFGPASREFDWVEGARRYYFNIVGKFGANVQKVLKKVADLDIRKICPLHGPVLDSDLGKYVALYDTWSSYRPEEDGIAVVHAGFYGNTARAAEFAAECLRESGKKVDVVDLVHQDVSYAVEAAYRYSEMIVAATTYEGGLNPAMEMFLRELSAKKFQSRKVGVIENGSFGPTAGKYMLAILGEMSVEIVGEKVTILSSMSEENKAEIRNLCGMF